MKSLEWRITTTFLLVLVAFAVIAKINIYRSSTALSRHGKVQRVSSQLFSVAIEGAVYKPGSYDIKSGTSLRKALSKARPKPNANLRQFDLDASLYAPAVFLIEELQTICIHIQIDGIPWQDIEIPSMSKVSDLKVKLQWPEGADTTPLKSRRLLKDGEIFNIIVRTCKK